MGRQAKLLRRVPRGAARKATAPPVAGARARAAPPERQVDETGVVTDPRAARWTFLDGARGVAIVAMIVYHACFDLAHFGWLDANFNEDWRWLSFRSAILASFLAIAGASLAFASAHGVDERRFWRRIAKLAGAALLVSAGSYAMFPQSFIWFGVLHAIVVMSVVTRYLLPLGAWLIPIGALVVAAGMWVAAPMFDRPALQWVGMMTFKPRTEDYVPMFPWLGAMLMGAGAGLSLVRRRQLAAAVAGWQPRCAATWLRWLGRHSLVVYLVHQPLMIGALMLAKGW